MDRVVDHLFISSLEDASNQSSLAKSDVKAIISLGCKTPIRSLKCNEEALEFATLEYEGVQDVPEAPIITLLDDVVAFVSSFIEKKCSVLVHCIYGQSRSATVIVAYLLSTGRSIEESIALLSKARPQICINPGFLAQLLLFSRGGVQSPEARNILQTYGPRKGCLYDPAGILSSNFADALGNREGDRNNTAVGCKSQSQSRSPGTGRNIVCRTCKVKLCSEDDVQSVALDYAEFVNSHVDPYWKGYKPLHPARGARAVAAAIKGFIVTGPLSWAMAQVGVVDKSATVAIRREGTSAAGNGSSGSGSSSSSSAGAGSIQTSVTSTVSSSAVDKCESHNGASSGQASTADTGNTSYSSTDKKQFRVITVTSSSSSSVSNSTKTSSETAIETERELRCPASGCSVPVGRYIKNGLNMCGGYLRCDLFALDVKKVMTMRKRPHSSTKSSESGRDLSDDNISRISTTLR
jgi:predicted protein tyrosine phosphatase